MKEDAIKAMAAGLAEMRDTVDGLNARIAEIQREYMPAAARFAEVIKSSFTIGEKVLLFRNNSVQVHSGVVSDICPGGQHTLWITDDFGTPHHVSVAMVMGAEAEAMKIGQAAVSALARELGITAVDPEYVPGDVWTITDVKIPGFAAAPEVKK